MHQTIHHKTLLGAMHRPGGLYEVVAAQGQSRGVAADLRAAERAGRVGHGALAPTARRDHRAGAGQWRRDAATSADPAVSIHLQAGQYDVAAPGEDGTPQSVSLPTLNFVLIWVGALTVLAWLGRWGGLL